MNMPCVTENVKNDVKLSNDGCQERYRKAVLSREDVPSDGCLMRLWLTHENVGEITQRNFVLML
jgi:hypothetical protein